MAEELLITGGAGFIGSHIAKALLADGYKVDIVDNLSTGKLENVPEGAGFYELDLRVQEAIARLPGKNFKAILHLAGQSSGEKSFDDPLYDLDTNARSTLLLSQWALERRIPKFIWASSMGIYGQVDAYPVPETAVPQPISYYGVSKFAAEQILSLTSRSGLQTVCFRMFNVYGPGQNLDNMKQGMVSIFLAQLLQHKPLLVKGSLDRVRDFIYIDDVVAAWKRALELDVSGIFNLGSGRATKVSELVAKLLKACGLDKNYEVQQGEKTPGDQFAMSADITAIRNALKWQPLVPLEEGITRMVSWARSLQMNTQ